MSEAAPKRRWFRFSLMSLLIGTAICTIPLGYLSYANRNGLLRLKRPSDWEIAADIWGTLIALTLVVVLVSVALLKWLVSDRKRRG